MDALIEQNITLGKFIGGKESNETRFPMASGQLWLPIHGVVDKRNLKFHKSWDWLMVVVSKVLDRNVPKDNGLNLYKEVEGCLMICDRELLFAACVRFVNYLSN